MAEDYTTRAVLTASVGQFIAGFKEAKATYQDFNQSMARSSMASTDAVANSSKVISTGMKVGAVAVAGLSIAAIKTGAGFEHQMSRVGAIAGASGKDLKGLNDQAIKLGADTAFSAKEAAGGMENLASAGMNSKQIMAAMPGVLNLAAVSGGDVALSAENAATALNGFGLEAKDSAHVADVFARAAADTNAEASDMGEALKMVAPQAHGAGLSLEETAAAIGVLSDAGIKGSMAGSNLGMALTKVQNPSKEAGDAMAELGFNAYDSSGKMKPLATQVDELKGKLSGMTDKQKQYYTSQIYGVQGGRAMNVLLQAQSGKLEGLTKSLQNSNGAADEMAKTMQNDLASSVEQLGGGFESTAIILEQTFSGVLKTGVDSITDSVGKFNDYLQKNQTQIQATTKGLLAAASGMAKFAPSVEQVGTALKIVLPSLIALEAFKGIGVGGARTVSMLETMQADLSLVQRGLIMTGTAAKSMAGLTVGTFGKIGSATKGAVVNVNSFNNAIMSASAGDKFKGMLTGIANGFTSIPSKAGNAGKAMVSVFTNPQAAATGLNTKMYALLQTVGASDAQIAKLTNTTMKGGTAMGKIGLAGEGASDAMLAGATSAGGLGMSLGVLLPIAAAVAVVAAAIYMAWDSNFMNIQGVVQSAIGGIKGIFDSMRPSISAVVGLLKPIGSILGGILKVVGAIAIGAIVVSVVALATALRLNVDGLAAIAKTAIAAGYAVEGMAQKMIPGGKDGSEAFDKAKKSIDGAKDSVVDMKDAVSDGFKTVVVAGSQMVKSNDNTSKSVKQVQKSYESLSSASAKTNKKMSDDAFKTASDLQSAFTTDTMTKYTESSGAILDRFNEKTASNQKAANELLEKAKEAHGEKQVQLQNKAFAAMFTGQNENNTAMTSLMADNSNLLVANKDLEGNELNESQRAALQSQNETIRNGLMQQQQLYIQMVQKKLENGQKLSETERTALVANLDALYQNQSDTIAANEAKMAELKTQRDAAKSTSEKANFDAQIATLNAHNDQTYQSQANTGVQMLQLLQQQSNLKTATVSQGLTAMHATTDEQLNAIYGSYIKSGATISQQLVVLKGIMSQRGFEANDAFIAALRSGNFSGIGQEKAQEVAQGIASMPPMMFKNGKAGQDKLAGGLRDGSIKVSDAGDYLTKQGVVGADKNLNKYEKNGGKSGDKIADGIKKKKGAVNSAVDEVTSSGANKIRDSYSSFNSNGQYIAGGVAAGIRANTGDAVSAMSSLVSQVNAEAKKKAKIHSPSRLLRDEVGKYLSLGVAEGINAHAYQATNAMSNVMAGVRDAANIKPLNFSFNANSIIDPVSADLNVNATDSTAVQLLRQLVNKQSIIVLDTGALVGETKDKFNDVFGQQIQTTGRWG